LLSDIQTRVPLKQPPEQVAVAEMFDLTERQRGWLGELVKGRADNSDRAPPYFTQC
jgi:hypothetical protein